MPCIYSLCAAYLRYNSCRWIRCCRIRRLLKIISSTLDRQQVCDWNSLHMCPETAYWLQYDQLHGFAVCRSGSWPDWVELSGKMAVLARLLSELRCKTDDRIVLVSNYTQVRSKNLHTNKLISIQKYSFYTPF